jgi:hypothetical protein
MKQHPDSRVHRNKQTSCTRSHQTRPHAECTKNDYQLSLFAEATFGPNKEFIVNIVIKTAKPIMYPHCVRMVLAGFLSQGQLISWNPIRPNQIQILESVASLFHINISQQDSKCKQYKYLTCIQNSVSMIPPS